MMRLILALSALLIIYIAPSEPDRLVHITYTALMSYSVYSFVLYLMAARRGGKGVWRAAHWIDIAWYLLLISLSSGTSSIFFFFFFFSILAASFLWGFAEGVRVTVVATVLFTIVGFATAPSGAAFELNRMLLRPLYLLALGYMIAYWGGFEIQLKRRLALLKEVNEFSNPRFGIGHTIAAIMKRVLSFYEAESCLLILKKSGSDDEYKLTHVRRDAPEEAESSPLPSEVARQFLALPDMVAVINKIKRRVWELSPERYYAYDLAKDEETSEGRVESEKIAATLDVASFISVPLVYRNQLVGRIYIGGERPSFEKFDIGFLNQIIEHVKPVLDNIRLLDQLASSAAEQERQKIARDIHDSVIQPYIGLQYKVAAIRNKLAAGGADVDAELEHLFAITTGEITGLRHYVRGLREATATRDDLLSAVRRYTAQFHDSYGISVRFECKTDINVNDRLAAELIQIVHEGLSNVRKHTNATSSRISLESRDKKIILSVENDLSDGETIGPFVPRSITDRAEALGGLARVERQADRTSVRVEIPL